MPITDYHKQVRDGIVVVMEAAYPKITVKALDDLESIPASLPFIGVACVGPERDSPGFHTNLEDGIGYPCAVALFAAGIPNGEKDGQAPEATLFRRQVRISFHNKRLAAVARVGWCEVSDSGPLWNRESPQFQKLSTAMVVTAVGRFPRS